MTQDLLRAVTLGILAGLTLRGLAEAPATMIMCLLLASPALIRPPTSDED